MGSGEVLKRLTILLTVNDAATAQLATVSSTMRSFAGVTGQASGQMAKLGQRFMQVGRALVSFLIIRTIAVQFARFINLMFEGNQVLEKATTSLRRLGGSLGYAQKQIEFMRTTAMRAPFDFQSILQAGRLLSAYGKDLQTYLPILLDWAAALGATSGELEGYAAAMGKIMAGSPYVLRILTTRAIGLDQWRNALEQTNRELPKGERFTQALMIALQRFEGQAAVLAKTMAGLRTNIRDVWVEITREIGLSMFTRIRAVLFDVYTGLRDIADNQREVLYEIGDVFGLWAGRIIIVAKESAKVGTYWNAMAGVVKHLAVFLVGRMLLMGIVRIVAQLGYAVKQFWAMNLAAKATNIVLLAMSVAAGSIAQAILNAKIAAIDFNIALGDISSGLSILIDFAEREEKVFTREEISSLRTMQIGIRDVISSLSDMGRKFAGMEKSPSWWNALGNASNAFIKLRNSFSVDALGPMIADLEDFVATASPLMLDIFGDEEWGARATGYVEALKQMSRAYEASGIVPDQSEWHNFVQKMGADLLSIVPKLEPMFALSEATRAAAEATVVNYQSQADALDAIKFIMEDYEGYQLGIAEAAESTAGFTITQLRLLRSQMVDMSGLLPLYQAIAKVESDVEQIEKDRVKALAEVFDAQLAAWDYTTRMAQGQAELTDNTKVYADALTGVLAQMEAWMADPALELTKEQWNQLREVLQGYQVELKNTGDTTNELAFSTQAAFSLWQQALSSIVNLVDAIGEGATAMDQAFSNAITSMLKWLGKLMLLMVIISILMQALNLSSGGMTGWGGALSVILGGGIGSAGRAFGGFKGGPQLAGAGIGGFPDVTQRTRSRSPSTEQTVIQINGDVLDGEHFMRLVDTANYKLQRRKGGGV